MNLVTNNMAHLEPESGFIRVIILRRFLVWALCSMLFPYGLLHAQINNAGCLSGGFGVDAGLYSNIIEYGAASPAANSKDWFYAAGSGGSGISIIDVKDSSAIKALLQGTGNPSYEARMNSGLNSLVDGKVRIDAVFSRDPFGGTGAIDPTSFSTASKNGEDPAIWDPGAANVLGKNDLVDVAGHMFRNGSTLYDDLWFVGLINRAEPGGDAYMDFEFFVEEVGYTPGSGFTSGGPDLGHTAFQFDAQGKITRVGDIIYTFDLTGGGTNPQVNIRVWVSRADFNNQVHPPQFIYAAEFDGAFNGSPFGYARIIPANQDFCGYVNKTGEKPSAPPWGTKNTKSHIYTTSYNDFSVAEMGLNMTAVGIDPVVVTGADSCSFPYQTFIVKTRASASFTAQLKDFAGPFAWGRPDVAPIIDGSPVLSCQNPSTTLVAVPQRTDVTYTWTTIDGNISGGNPASSTIIVDQPGTYYLNVELPTGCPLPERLSVVDYDATKPFFGNVSATGSIACNGNDGTITLSFDGATPPYSYLWSNGDILKDLANLSPGTYTVTITDVWGCTAEASAEVIAPTPVVITPNNVSPDCFGDTDGSISLSITGKEPLSYLWADGKSITSFGNLGAGTYSLTITDADNCQTAVSYTLSTPNAISAVTAKTDDTDPDAAVGDGTITLSNIIGGTPGYTFSWDGPESYTSTDEDLTALKYGLYTVTITDTKGCTYVTDQFIYEPEICNDNIDNDGDGLTDCRDDDCQPDLPVNLMATDSSPCTGVNVTYSVTSNADYTYLWTFPTNATIISGADASGSGGASVTVKWNTTMPGQVCVRSRFFDCLSAPVCIPASPVTTPFEPATINTSSTNN
jgi:hypothetical protein